MVQKKDAHALVILFIIAAIVYREWLSFSPFAFADWGFGFSSVLADFIFPASGGMFGSNIMLWKYPFLFINGVAGSLGFDYNVAEKLTVFWPFIFITPLASYLLVKKITRSVISAFVGSLIFTFNTYFLSINTQGHVLLPLAYAWSVLAILSFINMLDSKKAYWIPLSTLLLFIVGSIDLRSAYVTAIVVVLYALYNQFIIESSWKKELWKNFLRVSSVFVFLILLNMYWILPALNVQALTGNDLFYRELFGGEFYNIQNSLALFYPFWSGKEPTWFSLQKIPLHFWLYPVLAFTGLIVAKRNSQMVFFSLLALIGIFLSKQTAQPFPQVYFWLFENIPGFAAFREASKFNFLIIISYAVLIGALVSYLKIQLGVRKYAANLIIFMICLLPLWNTMPLLTGDIKTLFEPKEVPHDYRIINEYLTKDTLYSRVFALNYNIYWSFSTNTHPVTDAVHSINYYWKDLNLYDTESNMTEGEKMVTFLASDEGRRLLSSVSVGYLVVYIEDKQTNNNIRRDMGKNRAYFEESLRKIPYLEKQDLGLKSTLLYKNTEAKPAIYLTQEKDDFRKDVDYKSVDFKIQNPTEYKVHINKLSSPMYLNSINLYHPDWRIRLGNFNRFTAVLTPNYFIPDSFHYKNSFNETSYLLDPDYIKKHLGKSSYTQNKDGSINFDLTLYFKPQSYLYLGLLFSTFVFAALSIGAIYLILISLRGKRHEHN